MSSIKERVKKLIRVGRNAYKEVIELPLIFTALAGSIAVAIPTYYKLIHEFSKQIDKPLDEITVPRNTLIMAIALFCLIGFLLGICIKCVIDQKNSKNHSLENKIDNLGLEVSSLKIQLTNYQQGTNVVPENVPENLAT